MGTIVVVVYRPIQGKDAELHSLVLEHHAILLRENLVSERRPIIMRAKGGEVIEIFEWRSVEAIREAHTNAAVQKLWERFNSVCTYDAPINVAEFANLFSEFEPIDH